MSVRFAALALLFATQVCSSEPFDVLANGGISNVAYNAVTQTFTENAQIGQGQFPAPRTLFGLTQGYYDFVGTYNTTAIVDSTGTAHGGSVSLIGQSVSMGILAPSVFFTGTVLSMQYPTDFAEFVTTAQINFELPQVTALLGALDRIVIFTSGADPGFSFFSNPRARTGPWAGSFDTSVSFSHYDYSPFIARLTNSVPEPSPGHLVCAALLAFGIAGRSRAWRWGFSPSPGVTL